VDSSYSKPKGGTFLRHSVEHISLHMERLSQ